MAKGFSFVFSSRNSSHCSQFRPAAGRYAERIFEMPCQVALVREATQIRDVCQRYISLDQRTSAVETTKDKVSIGARSKTGTKVARDGISGESRDSLQLRRTDRAFDIGIQEIANTVHGPQVVSGQGLASGRAIAFDQSMRKLQDDFVNLQIVQRRIEIVESGRDGSGNPKVARYRVAHERQR